MTGTSFGGSVFDVGNGYTIRKLIGQERSGAWWQRTGATATR